MNPPDLLLFCGDWNDYEDHLYRIFTEEIARGGLRFRGCPVHCRRHPETAGRWAAFWHLVQEGPAEDDRYPDLRRCERLRWVRWIIGNAVGHCRIDEWQNMRGTEVNTLLWYREEYLVVLARRRGYWLLKTAYCTERNHRIRKLRKERDASRGAAGGRIQNN
ncbi:MAG: hypothetical protein OXI01_19000 [Albidovulum sp.]|nr:hypothetical protein [Albidovulum sp.]